MHRVAENLHVGGLDAAGDGAALRAAGIETVVGLTHDPSTGGYPDGVRVVREPMVDGPRNDATAFERVVDATRGTLAAGERTLADPHPAPVRRANPIRGGRGWRALPYHN